MMFSIFQLTALICFIFALKVKLYKRDLSGFLIITIIMLSVVLYHLFNSFENINIFEDIHYVLITGLLIFICIKSTYKKYKRSCICSRV